MERKTVGAMGCRDLTPARCSLPEAEKVLFPLPKVQRYEDDLGKLLVYYDFVAERLVLNEVEDQLEIDSNGAGVFAVGMSDLDLEELKVIKSPNPAFRRLILKDFVFQSYTQDLPLFTLLVALSPFDIFDDHGGSEGSPFGSNFLLNRIECLTANSVVLENAYARVPNPLFAMVLAACQENMTRTVEEVQVSCSAPAEEEQTSAMANIVELTGPEGWAKKSLTTPEVKRMGSANLSHLDFAPELFDEMPERDETAWNAYLGSDSFQIQIKLLSGKTLLHWVGSQDHVRDLTHALELKLGIPSEAQRLLHEGKQLEDLYPLSYYSINRNASITLALRLRGGAVGQSSSAKAFSYKDAVHSPRQEKTVPPVQAPKPFLVDKLEETPSIEIIHPSLDEQTQHLAELGIICRFNGLWPQTADLYQWIHSNWTNNCKVLLCSKGFFITVFAFEEDYQTVLKAGPWFWGSAGLFLTPWFPDFDPSSAIITKLPIWVRLPNLPAHLWHFAVFQGIGNTLGRLLDTDISRGQKGLYTYARICAEIDISKGLPDKINLKIGDFHWTQNLDYENTAFRCRNCHLTGHLQSSCPSKPAPKKKSNPKQKSKSWKPHDPPPMDDFDLSSDEEEMKEEEMETKTTQEPSSADPEDLSVHSSSQKRHHGSTTSDSDKEFSHSTQISLQITPVQQCPPEWVKVGKKKEKKLRIVDPSHVG